MVYFPFSVILSDRQLLQEAAARLDYLLGRADGAASAAPRLRWSHPCCAGCKPEQCGAPGFRKALSKEIQETRGMPLSIKE